MESIAIMLLRFTMKLVNFAMAIAGIPMVLYGIWMATVWHRDIQDSSIDIDSSASPWFLYTSLSIGIAFCFIACSGHISADSSNGFCLSCYTVIVLVLIFLETAVAADILLNPVWDLPEDPTGRFRDFKEFPESNFGFFKWVSFLLLLAQGSSVVLAMALRALGDSYRSNFERNEKNLPNKLPQINQDLHMSSKTGYYNDPKILYSLNSFLIVFLFLADEETNTSYTIFIRLVFYQLGSSRK